MANEATTIGQKLRQARLIKNISLDELQQITKIQKRYLTALEEGELNVLPGNFYVRAFIRQYAAAVGEDGDKLVAVLDGKASLEPPVAPRPRPEAVRGSRKAKHVDDTPTNPIVKLLPVIFFALVAIIIVGIVGYMTWQERQAPPIIATSNSSVEVEGSISTTSSEKKSEASSKPKKSSSTKESSTPPSTEEKKMAIKVDSNSQSEANLTITDADDPLNLTFTGTNGPCWVGVSVNGVLVYQYTIQAGETQSTTLPAKTANMSIVLGASGNIKIQANKMDLDFTDPNSAALQKNVNVTIGYKDAAKNE